MIVGYTPTDGSGANPSPGHAQSDDPANTGARSASRARDRRANRPGHRRDTPDQSRLVVPGALPSRGRRLYLGRVGRGQEWTTSQALHADEGGPQTARRPEAIVGPRGIGRRAGARDVNAETLKGCDYTYSARNAVTGSTRAAPHAGLSTATTATAATSDTAAPMVRRSSGVTPYSNPPRARVTASDPASPSTAPAPVIKQPSRNTSRTMLAADAPSARRRRTP